MNNKIIINLYLFFGVFVMLISQTLDYKIDLTNIKQLLLQCYDKVDIYIDDIVDVIFIW